MSGQPSAVRSLTSTEPAVQKRVFRGGYLTFAQVYDCCEAFEMFSNLNAGPEHSSQSFTRAQAWWTLVSATKSNQDLAYMSTNRTIALQCTSLDDHHNEKGIEKIE